MRALSIGEILWDLLPDGKHLGGAPFNFGVNLRRCGHQVLFATAVGDDPLGREAREKMRATGIDMRLVETTGRYPTGTVDVAIDAAGEPRYRIHRPAAYDDWICDGKAAEVLAGFEPRWIYFGTLLAHSAEGRRAVEAVLDACPHASRFGERGRIERQAEGRTQSEEPLEKPPPSRAVSLRPLLAYAKAQLAQSAAGG